MGGPQAWLDGPDGVQTDRQLDKQTDIRKISSFYRTSSRIGAAALLPKGRSRPIKRSRATADHLMHLGDWFLFGSERNLSNGERMGKEMAEKLKRICSIEFIVISQETSRQTLEACSPSPSRHCI